VVVAIRSSVVFIFSKIRHWAVPMFFVLRRFFPQREKCKPHIFSHLHPAQNKPSTHQAPGANDTSVPYRKVREPVSRPLKKRSATDIPNQAN
jgi:hypothetical protein